MISLNAIYLNPRSQQYSICLLLFEITSTAHISTAKIDVISVITVVENIVSNNPTLIN